MFTKNKKAILITAVIIAILLIIAIIATILNKRKAGQFVNTSSFQKVSTQRIYFPTISDNKILFFANETDSGFYQMDLNGQNIQRISEAMDTPEYIIWSPDHKLALLKVTYNKDLFEKYGSPFVSSGTEDQTLTTWYYNIATKKLKKLNDDIDDIIWTKDNKIIYQNWNPEKNISNLNIADADGSNATKLADLPSNMEYGLSLFFDGKNLIATESPSDVSPANVYTFSLEQKIFQKIKEFDSSTDTTALSNDKILFNLPSKNSSELVLMNPDGKGLKKLGVYGTPAGSFVQLKEDIFLLAGNSSGKNTSEAIFQLNLTNNRIDKIKEASKDENINIINLMLSPDKKTLYFTSNDILYKLSL